jgi:tRNA-(ms[2]io[6]A)-hydroxylase
MPSLVEPLTALAREESEHFRLVHEQLDRRSERLGLPASDGYVTKLIAAARKDRHEYPTLLDKLLVAALIEGRSCERFRLLAERLPLADLRAFYRDLMVSEARHFTLFCTLATDAYGRDATRSRLTMLAAREAEIVKDLSVGPQVHG